MFNIHDLDNSLIVTLPDGSNVTVTTLGSVHINQFIILSNVFYVPNFTYNLLSIRSFFHHQNLVARFDSKCCVLQDLNSNQILAFTRVFNGLYVLKCDVSIDAGHNVNVSVIENSRVNNSANLDCRNCNTPCQKQLSDYIFLSLLHALLGHSSLSKIRHLHMCKSSDFHNFICQVCQEAKFHRLPF